MPEFRRGMQGDLRHL